MQTYPFQADIKELLHLIIHAFYSNKEVFLRELISNASDALEKKRLENITSGEVNTERFVRVYTNKEEMTLTIEDNGIGMNEDSLVRHLSTIAKSGTKEFLEKIASQKENGCIGQFGVGFYSAFLVAKRVDVLTKQENDDLYHWKSNDTDQSFSIEKVQNTWFIGGDGEVLTSGTQIILYLKEDCLEYLEETTLKRLIEQYSLFILFPIYLRVLKKEEPTTTTQEDLNSSVEMNKDITTIEEEQDDDNQDEIMVDEQGRVTTESSQQQQQESSVVNEGEEQQKEEKEVSVKVEWERMNETKPLWSLNPNTQTIEKEQYNALYKKLTKEYSDPLFYRHFVSEGIMEFRGILYIPQYGPFDFSQSLSKKRQISLYCKNVMILEELDTTILPDWMSFVRGVIESPDLPLNVSREMLQQTKWLQKMKTQLKKQILQLLKDLKQEETTTNTFDTFYRQFEKYIKMGIHEGETSLLDFLRIQYDRQPDTETISLQNYITEKCLDGQKAIYYTTGKDEHPLFSIYRNRGYCVLRFPEAIDEFMLQKMEKYQEYSLVNIQKEHEFPWVVAQEKVTDTNENEQEDEKEDEQKENDDGDNASKTFSSFFEKLKKSVNDPSIEDIRFSSVVTGKTDEPGFILSSKHGWTGNMEKIMSSQPLNETNRMMWMKGKKIWELNRHHPSIEKLLQLHEKEDKHGENLFDQSAHILYNCSLLHSNYPLYEQDRFIKNLYQLQSIV